VLRLIEAGSTAECPHCGERVKFRARHRDQQVICNVYVDGKWDRVEQYHDECYVEAGEPHGEAVKKQRENLRQMKADSKTGNDADNTTDKTGTADNAAATVELKTEPAN
jgi:DNA-directed RNA polymerase subunit RPC12/RpoP